MKRNIFTKLLKQYRKNSKNFKIRYLQCIWKFPIHRFNIFELSMPDIFRIHPNACSRDSFIFCRTNIHPCPVYLLVCLCSIPLYCFCWWNPTARIWDGKLRKHVGQVLPLNGCVDLFGKLRAPIRKWPHSGVWWFSHYLILCLTYSPMHPHSPHNHPDRFPIGEKLQLTKLKYFDSNMFYSLLLDLACMSFG